VAGASGARAEEELRRDHALARALSLLPPPAPRPSTSPPRSRRVVPADARPLSRSVARVREAEEAEEERWRLVAGGLALGLLVGLSAAAAAHLRRRTPAHSP